MIRRWDNWSEKDEVRLALIERFKRKEISEDELRAGLASLGFNATQIEEEVEMHK